MLINQADEHGWFEILKVTPLKNINKAQTEMKKGPKYQKP